MLMTLRIRLPVAPFHVPERTLSAKLLMRSSTAWTSGTTFLPSTRIVSSLGARSATWRTARSSVTLIFSPVNIASIRFGRPHSSASRTSRRIVSSVIRFFE